MRVRVWVVVSMVAALVHIGPTVVVAAAPATSHFEPIAPCRLVDTRSLGDPLPARRVTPETLAGCDIPGTATAAAITVTVTSTTASGFVVAAPAGEYSETSTINFGAGETRANGALIGISPKGIDVVVRPYPNRAHLIVDVTGYFAASTSATAGRFVPVTPTRLADTREGGGGVADRVVIAAPPGGSAVSLNVTVTGGAGAGFVTVYPAGGSRPHTSSVNTDGPDQTRAAGVVVPVGVDGKVVVEQVHAGGHLVVDLTGYFTDELAPASTDGLFIPITPTRALDTRDFVDAFAAEARLPWLAPGGTAAVGLHDAAANATQHPGAIAANVTIVAGHAGFVTLAPAGFQDHVPTSSVNTSGEPAVANMAITQLSVDNRAAVRSSHGADAIVDITGVFTGAGLRAGQPPGTCCDEGAWNAHEPWARAMAEAFVPADILAYLDASHVLWHVVDHPGSIDGRSAPGVISLDPSLQSNPASWVQFTVLHEVAHQLRQMYEAGPYPRPEPSPNSLPNGYLVTDGEEECISDLVAERLAGGRPANFWSNYDGMCGPSAAARATPDRVAAVDNRLILPDY